MRKSNRPHNLFELLDHRSPVEALDVLRLLAHDKTLAIRIHRAVELSLAGHAPQTPLVAGPPKKKDK